MICIGMLAVYLPINAYPVSDSEISVGDLGSAESGDVSVPVAISDDNGQDGNTDNETGADDASQIPDTAENQAPPAPNSSENQEDLPAQPGTENQELPVQPGAEEQEEVQEYPGEEDQEHPEEVGHQEPQRQTPERELIGACHSARFAGGMITRVAQNSSVIVTATYSPSANIPNNATFVVYQLIGQEDAMFTDAVKASDGLPDGMTINNIVFYYISFYYNGEKIQPSDDVNIHFDYIQIPFSTSETNAADTVTVLHFPDALSEAAEESLSRVEQVVVELGDQVIIEDISLIEDVLGRVNVIEPTGTIDDLAIDTPQFSIFAVALTTTQQTGTVYQRVESINDPNASYLIVSVDGAFALSASNSINVRPINLVQVYGHPQYYSTDSTITPDLLFNFSGAGSQFTIRSLTNQYLNIPQARGAISFSSDAQQINANFMGRQSPFDPTRALNSWVLGNGTHDLAVNHPNVGPPGFQSVVSSREFLRHMVIYKQVSYTLTVPEAFQGNNESDIAPTDPFPAPSFPAYDRPISGEVLGHWNWNGHAVHPIYYASDPSTSMIERDEIFSGNRADDGKIWADKSVIYGADDYDAFTQYDDGVFSVTLSALAQRSIDELRSYDFPLDFVFVLDTSGSMNERVNGLTRGEMLVTALNVSIHTIMRSHPQNRVGIVHYDSYANDVLQLGRFHVGTGGTPNWDSNVIPDYFTSAVVPDTGLSPYPDLTIMRSNPNLRNSTTGNVVNINDMYFFGATHKQLGIQYGANMLLRNNDLTYTPRPGLTMSRTPVIVLFSDGVPTVGTNHWMDPSSAPMFGIGNNLGGGAQGILGFYTILSANYFKSQVSRHYNTDTMFYTVGFGISGSDSANPFQYALTQGAGDEYARAILNPTPEYIRQLRERPANSGGNNIRFYGRQLYALLNNQPLTGLVSNGGTDDFVWVGSRVGSAPFGISNSFIPVTANPYLSAGICFSYATATYISDELTPERNTAMMAKTVGRAPVRELVVHDLLQRDTLVRFTDYIYEGMEIKSTPVIRFNGTNYPLQQVSTVTESQVTTVTYRPPSVMVRDSEGNYVNLNLAEVRIITQADGRQSLEWSFPERLLPAYRKSFWFDYYFEMLPIRLVYQVGLTYDAVWQAVQGTDSTFFVGEWQDRTANVTFSPNVDNPFYANSANISHLAGKANNVTDSLPFSLSKSGSASAVTIQLGNNGRISTDNFIENALPDTGGTGRMAVMFAGLMVILAGGAFFARHYLRGTKKYMGGN